jgi:hypothetical protein
MRRRPPLGQGAGGGRPSAFTASAALLWLAAGTAAAADQAPLVGLWQTIDDRTGKPRAIIRIGIEKGRLQGRIEHVHPRPGESLDPSAPAAPAPAAVRR